MPLYPLNDSELNVYRNQLSNADAPAISLLKDLKTLYSRFILNQEKLATLSYEVALQQIEQEYAAEKKKSQERLAELKKMFKQIDNRIISIEQKLSHGIPEDLNLMDKLIAEQESIVEEQEKLNAAESALADQVSEMDVEHGKKLSRLEQEKLNRLKPLTSEAEHTIKILTEEERKITLKTNLLALVPLVLIPVFVDFIAGKIGFGIADSKLPTHSIFAHYLYFVALVLTAFFLIAPVKDRIFKILALNSAKTSFEKLEDMFKTHSRAMKELR